MVSARPIAGQPIETVWGGEVHDAAVARIGVQFGGGATVGVSSTLNLSLVAGHAGMVDSANKWILIPFAGLWRIQAIVAASGGGATGSGLYRVNVSVDGVAQTEVAWPSFGGILSRTVIEIVRTLAAGAKVSFASSTLQGGGTPAYSVDSGVVLLEAQSLV